MQANTIHYIGTKTGVIEMLKTYFQQQGFDFIPYAEDKNEKVPYLLLIEPIYNEEKKEGYSISRIWRYWLAYHNYQTTLMVASHVKSTHKNCLWLLDLPPIGQFKAWLTSTPQPIQHYQTELVETDGNNHFHDDWDFHFPLTGLDLKKVMQNFLNGHQGDLYSMLVLIRSQIMNAEEDQEDQLTRLLAILRQRWSYYKPFFKRLPFHNIELEIDRFIENISKGNVQLKQINVVRNLIEQELHPIVQPEDYM